MLLVGPVADEHQFWRPREVRLIRLFRFLITACTAEQLAQMRLPSCFGLFGEKTICTIRGDRNRAFLGYLSQIGKGKLDQATLEPRHKNFATTARCLACKERDWPLGRYRALEMSLPELRVYSRRRFIRISPLFAIGLALAKNSADEVPPMPQAKVMLLRTGSTFKIVCSDCGQTISKRLENEHAAYCHADLVVQHQATCPGEKMSWVRHLLRITAS